MWVDIETNSDDASENANMAEKNTDDDFCVDASDDFSDGDIEYLLDPEKPLVLLLGKITHEGVTSALCASGRQYKQKYPESSIKNWETILGYFHRYNVREVIWKLSPITYDYLNHPKYLPICHELMSKIASRPHVLFVHRELLSGEIEEESFPSKAIIPEVNKLFKEHKLNVLPYDRNAEVTVLALEFIADTEQGLLLRVYVPSGRLWANETDRLLQLFRDYLARVNKLKIRLDQTRTDRGIIYEFHGDPETHCDLSAEFDQFSQFVDLCITNPDQAREILTNKNIAVAEVSDILTRYGKEAKRLHVDMKHDRERKILNIRQRMESELVDVLPDTALTQVEALIDSIVPRIGSSRAAITVDQSPLQITGAANVTLNLQPQIIHAVNSVVASEVRGDVHLTSQDQQLLSLIEQYDHTETTQLASAVHELADTSAPKPGRLLAKQRIVKFLIGITDKIGDVAAGLLQAYLQSKIGL